MKIIPPEGYEIDEENSTFECIKFKPIKKDLTYKDVYNNIFNAFHYFVNSDGKIESISLYPEANDFNATTSKRQLKKVLAINQLFNIAKYYNGDWEPNMNKSTPKYSIAHYYEKYIIDTCNFNNAGVPLFKNKEDAQSVIDNPNFREILDTIFK